MLSVHTGKEVSLKASRVEKRHLTRRTPTSQYYLVEINNYVVWCLNGTGLMYMIISLGLYQELGLRVPKGAKRHLFHMVNGQEK